MKTLTLPSNQRSNAGSFHSVLNIKLSIPVIGAALLILCALPTMAVERQILHGHVPRAIGDLKLPAVGRLSGTNMFQLAIGLPLRNQEGLTRFLQELYTPGGPNFRKFLTPRQFTEKFCPTEQDYEALIEFARSNGLTVSCAHSNRLLLDIKAPAADIERVFHVTMRLYQHPTEAREFYAPDSEPSLDLSVPVLFISGLNNYMIPHRVPEKPVATGRKGEGNGGAQGGSGPGGSFMAQDLRNAYLPGSTLSGTGQSVGLLEFSGFHYNLIDTYMYQNGILPFTAEGFVQNWELDGATGIPDPSNTNATAEVELDIEMAMALANSLDSIIVYELPTTTPIGKPYEYAPPDDALNLMAVTDLCNQLSSSWEYEVTSNTDQIFQEMAAQGQSFFQASGDGGGRTGENVYSPFDDPYITLVGATELTTGKGGAWSSEIVWNDPSHGESGGGISPNYPIPWWQQEVNMSANGGSTAWRNMPDVAIVGDNVYAVYGEGAPGGPPAEGGYEGTSVAAPLWASYMAVINFAASEKFQPPVGFINPAVYTIGKGQNPSYSYAACFHDIISGNNENTTSPDAFSAVTGYDLCTGWGTPKIPLINALIDNYISYRPPYKFWGRVINTPNLIGYWRFDPWYRTNSWVNGWTGTLEGNAQIGPPGSGCPLPLDETNQALVLDPNNDSWLLTSLTGQVSSQGTMLAWVYLTAQPSSVGHYFDITSQSQFGNDFDLLIQTDNYLYFYTDNGTATVYPQALPLNHWHFLAATFVANTNRSIYLDGVLVAASTPGNHMASTNPFTIGESDVFTGRYFAGKISDVAVYNRALSMGEISAIYSASWPILNLTPGAGAVVLTWPTNNPGFTLQQNTNLATTHWVDLPGTPTIVGDHYAVTSYISNGPAPNNLFFRLRQ